MSTSFTQNVIDFRCLVSTAVDLCRLSNQNPFAMIQLRRLLQIGKEVDLLEALRRSEKNEEMTIDSVLIHSANLQIDPSTTETTIFPLFQEEGMIQLDESKVVLNYTETQDVYEYGKRRLVILNENESKLAALLCNSTRQGVPIEELDQVLELFPVQFRGGLRRFLFENKILQSFNHKGSEYVTSPRIFKNDDKLKEAKEILTDHKFDSVINFIDENPGNPLPVVGKHIQIDNDAIKLLSQTGIIDPVRLDVGGDVKDYLFASDILNKRTDKDHFDLVRKTLANFRFGEYYSQKTRLHDLDRFFEVMLEHGYAGKAVPIGTDYQNLEWAGVFRIEKIHGTDDYRFWMLKRDVIEDARSVLRGYIPIQSSLENVDLSNIENVVQTRSQMTYTLDAISKTNLLKALRQIQEGLSPS